MPCLAKECFWPLIASLTPEVKINHAHVTTQRILIKFIDEISYMVYGLAVMPSIPSWSKITTMALIDKMGQSFDSLQTVLWHSLCSLHGVFGWSASGIGKSSGSLLEVFKGSLCCL